MQFELLFWVFSEKRKKCQTWRETWMQSHAVRDSGIILIRRACGLHIKEMTTALLKRGGSSHVGGVSRLSLRTSMGACSIIIFLSFLVVGVQIYVKLSNRQPSQTWHLTNWLKFRSLELMSCLENTHLNFSIYVFCGTGLLSNCQLQKS